MRVASLDSIQPVALQELNDILERQLTGGGGTNTVSNLGGIEAAAGIMNFIDSNIEAEVMEGIKEVDELMAGKIADQMFVFDNLIDVEDRGIQAILREVSYRRSRAGTERRRYIPARENFPQHVQACCRTAA